MNETFKTYRKLLHDSLEGFTMQAFQFVTKKAQEDGDTGLHNSLPKELTEDDFKVVDNDSGTTSLIIGDSNGMGKVIQFDIWSEWGVLRGENRVRLLSNLESSNLWQYNIVGIFEGTNEYHVNQLFDELVYLIEKAFGNK